MLTFAFASFALAASSLVSADSTITQAPTATAHALVARATPSPLTDYTYSYSDVPYKVNPYAYLRGPQSGYNQCNTTTEGPDSQCQTLIMNAIDDFCLWGAPGTSANETVGDVEAAMVAYCSRSGHGSRILRAGAIQGIQFMRTSQYIQIAGYIDQTALGLQADDTGGEEDPHGADQLGNPLGSLVFSNGLPGGDNTTLEQAVEWNNFVGSGVFCFKLCSPTANANYCQNKYDLLGCSYNMPADYAAINGTFQSCEGDLQDVVGTYTDSAGQTQTWSQPASLAADTTLPWTPRVPASSNCVTYQSSDLYPLASLGYQAGSAAATASSSVSASNSQSTGGTASASRSGVSSGSAATAAGAAASHSTTQGASSGAIHRANDDLWAFGAAMSIAAALVGGAVVLI